MMYAIWNTNENGELERGLRSRISGAMFWLVFCLMKAGKFGNLMCGNPGCLESRRLKTDFAKSLAIRSLKEADLSEPKSVRVSGCNSVTTKLGGNTVTLYAERGERVGGSGARPRKCLVGSPETQIGFLQGLFPSGIYGVRGVWETQKLCNHSRDVGKPLWDARGVIRKTGKVVEGELKLVASSLDALLIGKRHGWLAASHCNRPLHNERDQTLQRQDRQAGSNPAGHQLIMI